jgi:single-stranded-DNA-specific exonuclease
MSFLKKEWRILNQDKTIPPFEKICLNRGIKTKTDLDLFTNTDINNLFFDPFLLKDVDKAIEIINKAIANQERIMIYGDYDVDGISATAIMYLGLKNLNANVSYRLPHRVADGYGLNRGFIQECREIGVKLIITVDCGIANNEEIEYANSVGIPTIITDHHTPQEVLPSACAIINPKQKDCPYPFPEICGATVAYKLILALLQKKPASPSSAQFEDYLLELATLGTVADCCPLISENRALVKSGLLKLARTQNPALKNLLVSVGANLEKIDTFTIGYLIGPRLNAAGRLDTAYSGLDLLLGKKEKIPILDKLNKARQALVKDALLEVEEITKNISAEQKVIIAHNQTWHVGIIGLIAGKLVEKYYRPSIVMHEKNNLLIGSARSIANFDIMQALSEVKSLFNHFGGHKLAAGFSLPKENLLIFKSALTKIINQTLPADQLFPDLNIDCELAEPDFSFDLVQNIERLAPFGLQNEKPIFMMRKLDLKKITTVGSDAQHLKIDSIINNLPVTIIGFNQGQHKDYFYNKKKADFVFVLEINTWRNTNSLQLRVLDFD